MATPPVIDFPSLLAPIPGENPAGNRAFTSILRNRVNDFRDGFDPDNPPSDRSTKGTPLWKQMVDECATALTKKCKDLEICGWYTEGLLMRHGFAGARDGLRLMRELWETAWDRFFPAIDPEDEADSIATRIARFSTFIGDGKPFFIMKMRMTTLLTAGDEAHSWQSWKEGKGNFASALGSANRETLLSVREDLLGVREEATKIEELIVARSPSSTMAMMDLINVIDECLKLVPAPGEAAPEAVATVATAGGTMVVAAPKVRSRQDIYDEVVKLAKELEEKEPHSPVHMILRKIGEMQNMRFEKLVEIMTGKDTPLEFVTPKED